MHSILAIAKREVKRVFSRFRGGSSPILLYALIVALVVSFLALRQGPVLSAGMYRVGVSPDGPSIADGRFTVLAVDPASGLRLLASGEIDAYVARDVIHSGSRTDQRAMYAAGALKRHLERQQLARISTDHELDVAFPLRVQVNYLPAPSGASAEGTMPIGDILEALQPGAAAPAESGSPSEQDTSADSQPTDPGTREQAAAAAVREQVRSVTQGGDLPRIEMEFAADKQTIIPSLMTPPIPFAQVILAFLYVLPVSFISVFFTSSFMSEKTDRRIVVLLSAPISPFQIIIGKMLPYVGFSLFSVIVITLVLRGNLALALAIFVPVILFIFAIYLMVPLLYRTFKDTT